MTQSRSPNPQATVWPDEFYERVAPAAGRACFGLLTSERRWVHRRVETISLLSAETARRTVSVDFTVPSRLARLLRLPGGDYLVPLATLQKQPLRHFDLRDETGGSVPLLGREHNGMIAAKLLESAVDLALRREGLGPPPAELVSRLETIATGTPAEAETAIGGMVEAAASGQPEFEVSLDDDRVRSLILDLAESYVLLAQARNLDQRRILKFSYETNFGASATSPSIFQRIGWTPMLIESPVPAAIGGISYHAEVEVPDELRIDGAVIVDRVSLEIYGQDDDSDRAAIHAPNVPQNADPALLFVLRAERWCFARVAFAVSVVTAGLLLLGSTVGDLDSKVAGPPITVLLAGSALFSAVAARTGEHNLVRVLLLLPRRVLFLNALASLVAAATLALGLSSSAICVAWWICFSVAAVAAAILGVTFRKAAPTEREVIV